MWIAAACMRNTLQVGAQARPGGEGRAPPPPRAPVGATPTNRSCPPRAPCNERDAGAKRCDADHCFGRLDKPVSGILILAKGGSAARRAMALMEVADVNKL